MARRQTITQAAISRAVKGAQAAGLKVGRVEIEGGKIVLYSEEQAAADLSPLESWRARRGSR